MSLDRVKFETSASQYVLWQEYMDWEVNAFDKTCYYLMQIAAEIRRSYVKRGVVTKIEDFIMKFVSKKKERPMDAETATMRSKMFFASLTRGKFRKVN